MSQAKKYLSLSVIIIVLLLSGAAFFRYRNKPAVAPLPPALPYNTLSQQAPTPPTQNPVSDPTPIAATPTLPAEINLQVPFTSQAPLLNWSLPYQQFCEEASVLMAESYINNQPIANPKDADAKLLAIKNFEMKKFGFYEDTTAEETAVILREYYNLKNVAVVPEPTVADIKNALAKGQAVIVPLAGRQLGNPYYQQPGPLYHMLVIKGYQKNGDFITNDPGTKRGADFIYKADVLMQAIHDWNGGQVDTGKKVMLIVG
jgi:hypothetical protein